MLTYFNPLLIKAEWYRHCIHLISLNLHYFKKDEAIGLKHSALRSMASPPHKTSSKFTNQFKSYLEGNTDRDAGDFESLLSIFGK
jgi:hypothetical protein